MVKRLLWLANCLTVASLMGCGEGQLQVSPTSGPSSTTPPAITVDQTATTAPAPLSAKALLPLDQIQPPVLAPQGKPADAPVAERAKDQYDTAKGLYENRKYPAAASALEKAIGYDPKSPAIHRLLGLTYAAMGDLAKAGPHLTAAVASDGDDMQVQTLLGQIDGATGRGEEAISHFRAALLCSDLDEAAPQFGQLLMGLGFLLQQQGYLTASLQIYDRLADAVDQHGDTYLKDARMKELVQAPESLLLRRGELLIGLRRYPEAAETLDAAYRQNKSMLAAGVLLVKAQLAGKQFDKAEATTLELLHDRSTQETTGPLVLSLYQAMHDPAGPGRMLQSYKKKFGDPPPATVVAIAGAMYQMGAIDQAKSTLSGLAETMPGFAPGSVQLARWYLADAKFDEAMDLLARVLEKDAAPAASVRDLIEGLGAKAFPAGFDQKYAASARADASARKFVLHYLAGLVGRTTGKKHLAAEQFELSIQTNGQFPPAYEALAETYLELGESDKMTRLIEDARKQYSQGYLPSYLQGRLHMEKGEVGPGIVSLRQSVAADESHVPSRLLLARLYTMSGQYNKAKEQLMAAISKEGNEQAYELLVGLMVEQDDFKGAQAALNDLRVRNPDSPLGLRLLTEMQLSQGKLLDARESLGRLMKVAPKDVKTRLLKVRVDATRKSGRQILTARRFAQAMAGVQEILKDNPDNTDTLSFLTDLLITRRAYGEAAVVCGRVYNAMPNDASIGSRYARLLLQAQKPAEAAKVLDKLLSVRADDRNLMLLQISALSQSGQHDQAIEILTQWIAKKPEVGEVSGSLGRLTMMMEVGQTRNRTIELLLEALEGALATGGEFREAMLAMVYAKAGRPDDGLQVLDKMFAHQTSELGRGAVRALRLRVYAQTDQFDRLLTETDKWLGDSDSRVESMIPCLLGLLHLAKADRWDQVETLALSAVEKEKSRVQGASGAMQVAGLEVAILEVVMLKPELAQKLYEKFLAENPENPALLKLAMAIYPQAKDMQKVSDLSERAMKLSPESPTLLNNLGYLWADHGIRLDEAERMIRQADALEPAANVKDSLGWVKYKQGDLRAAVEFFSDAIADVDEEHAVIYDHAGDAYWRLGQKDKAVELWTEAADLAEAEVMQNESRVDEDVRRVAEMAPRKIQAAREGKVPPVAPLGEGVTLP